MNDGPIPLNSLGLEDTDRGWRRLAPVGVAAGVALLALTFVGNFPFGWDNDRSTSVVKLALALGALLILVWEWRLERRGAAKKGRAMRQRVLVAIGLSAVLGYFNFGHLHYPGFVHFWDSYHYYMGAKYFPELSYERIYDCAMVAQNELGQGAEVRARHMMDLRTNTIVSTDEVLAHPDERCKKHFSPERWQAYRQDVQTWRAWESEQRWTDIHKDHGYNPTPVWTIAGYLLANLGAASWDQVVALNLLDPLYLLLTMVMVWWAFGPRAFAMAGLVLGTHFPNSFMWTGGAFLRHDWLFYVVASICLLKRERPFLAGAAIAYATLLRLFPGLLIVGPVIAGVEYLRVNRRFDPKLMRFIAGGLVATALLLSASTALVGGVDAWKAFTINITKHFNAPATNTMGLRTVLSYRPTTTGSYLHNRSAVDPWAVWKDTRLEKWNNAKPLFVGVVLAALALVWLAIRHNGPKLWLGASLAVGFMVIGVELANYYYCFFIGLALLVHLKPPIGMLISCLCAVTQVIALHPLPGMSDWTDEIYVSLSVATLIAVFGAWWAFTAPGARALEARWAPPPPRPR